jgi:hypothetical protein
MYGKHYQSTYTGSMIGSGPDVFAVWGYVIANARDGEVELNPKMLSMILGCEEQRVHQAIDTLCQPDSMSRCKDFDGRRLVPNGPFLYEVPTHLRYQTARNDEERKEGNRLRKRKQRELDKLNGVTRDMSHLVTGGHALSRIKSTQTQTQTQTEEEKSSCFVLENEASRTSENGSASPKTPEKKPRSGPLMNADAMERFERNPAYEGIDVNQEAWKFKSWCQANKKPETVKRFTNWLNRIV